LPWYSPSVAVPAWHWVAYRARGDRWTSGFLRDLRWNAGEGQVLPVRARHCVSEPAARLLLANGAPANMQAAIFAYNHSGQYVTQVLDWASRCADGGAAVTTASSNWASRTRGAAPGRTRSTAPG
jgi:hypothetical protein